MAPGEVAAGVAPGHAMDLAPPLDRGAAICAALVFTVGLALIAFRGARDSVGA